tara:strand:+ start:680 stop:2488 length:1809 start_codon:yes stop_codon:yes gene_type:complete
MSDQKYHLTFEYPNNANIEEDNILVLSPDTIGKNLTKKNVKYISSIWTDSSKEKEDYQYIISLQEKLLNSFGESMNQFLNVKKSQSFWSIIYTNIFSKLIVINYEKWIKINFIIKNYNITSASFLAEILKENLDLNSFDYFIESSDEFNSNLYKKILFYLRSDLKIYLLTKNHANNPIDNRKEKKTFRIKIPDLFSISINLLRKIFNKNKNILNKILGKEIISVSPKVEKAVESALLKNFFVKKYFNKKKIIKKLYDKNMRESFLKIFNFEPKNKFETFFKFFLIEHLPCEYFEYIFEIVKNPADNIKTFKSKYTIFNSDEIIGNDLNFKLWLASQKNQNSQLFAIQNGGNRISPSYSLLDYNLKMITDRLFTFAKNLKSDYMNSIGFVRIFNEKLPKINFEGDATMILFTPYKYVFTLTNTSHKEWSNYIDDQLIFLSNLNSDIRKKVNLRFKKRLISNIYSDPLEIKHKIKTKFKELKIDDYKKTFLTTINNKRIVICTYHATSMLESLSVNFPTIIIHNFKKFKINNEYKKLYEELANHKIIHHEPVDASNHLNSIWNNIEEWWNDKKLQKSRLNFCEALAYTPKKKKDFLIDQLNVLN